jgi:hypothetical protein
MEWRRRGGAVRRLNAVGGRPPPTAARRRWPRGGHRLRTVGRPRLSGSTGAGEEMGQAGLSGWAKTDAEAREGKEPKSKSLQNLKWKSKANLRQFLTIFKNYFQSKIWEIFEQQLCSIIHVKHF